VRQLAAALLQASLLAGNVPQAEMTASKLALEVPCFGVRQLAAAFLQASLLAALRLIDSAQRGAAREQARGRKAAASCRTPKLP